MTRFGSRLIILAGILPVAMLFFVAFPAWSRSTGQATSQLEGLPNWGRATETLYRGGQPALDGFKALQHMGVTIVVNFRDEPKETKAEQRDVESLGMKYVSIPWSGRDNPSSSQVVEFLDFVRTKPQAKIFFNFQRGADRTGVMIAAYRIAVEHKPANEAVAEMRQFHYDHFWLPQLERYVRSLPDLLSGNSVFSAYAPAPSTSFLPNAASAVAAAVAPAIR